MHSELRGLDYLSALSDTVITGDGGEYAKLIKLVRKAAQSGAECLSQGRYRWDLSRGCISPMEIIRLASPEPDRPVWHTPLRVTLVVGCRRCDVCLRHRREHWCRRIIDETMSAPRTWFLTLTFRPELQYAALIKARAACTIAGEVYDQLTGQQQFARRQACLGPEVTLFLKRLRKTGAQVRYIVVAEPHKSGHVHYHLMLHEVCHPVRKATIQRCWIAGFSQAKLVQTGHSVSASRYVAKYISKTYDDALSRVRASVGYGRGKPPGTGETSALYVPGCPPQRTLCVPNDWLPFPEETARNVKIHE